MEDVKLSMRIYDTSPPFGFSVEKKKDIVNISVLSKLMYEMSKKSDEPLDVCAFLEEVARRGIDLNNIEYDEEPGEVVTASGNGALARECVELARGEKLHPELEHINAGGLSFVVEPDGYRDCVEG